MSSSQITYNPGILGESELVRSFVVRQKSLELVIETLRENSTASANRHLLIVGPRGIGKTMLVRRAATAVKLSPELQQWYPLVFGEESYPVGSPGEFWLEAIFHLADQTGDERIKRTFSELQAERDDTRLAERALAQLMDFADQNHVRIVLVVENLNTLLAEQMDKDAAWDLRHTLLNEPRLMLLGTATNRLDEIAHVGHAWFEMFSVHQLQPLNLDECGELWHSVTGSKIERGPLRAIRILTGGNPRLLKILAAFAANHSFRELMQQLVHLIDDHTEYFKGHLDALAPKERKVFVALLERWDPVGAADLAKETRLGASEVSALLARLCTRGAAEVVEQKRRKKLYQASERLYNIYYLMRRRGHPEGRVQAAVQFMVTFYEKQELISRLAQLAREACELPADIREDYYRAYIEILRKVKPIKLQVLQITPVEFFHAADIEISRLIGAPDFVAKAGSLLLESKFSDAEKLYRHALKLDNNNTLAWLALGTVLGLQARWPEAEESFHNAIRLSAGDYSFHMLLCLGAAQLMNSHFEEAEETFRKVTDLKPAKFASHAWVGVAFSLLNREQPGAAIRTLLAATRVDEKNALSWDLLSRLYFQGGQLSESEHAIRQALSLEPTKDRWFQLGTILGTRNHWNEAEQVLLKGLELDPEDGKTWAQLGRVRFLSERLQEAEQALQRAVELVPGEIDSWVSLSGVYFKRGRHGEAEAALRKAIDLAPQDPEPWRLLGYVLQAIGPAERAETFWRQALNIHGAALAACSVELMELQLELGASADTILCEAEEWATRSAGDPEALSAIAKFVVKQEFDSGLPRAERWAREAFDKKQDSKTSEALSSVLAAMDRWQEAIVASQPMLDDSAEHENARDAVTELMIRAAAAGYAKDVLSTLGSSKSATALEPLIVGLRIYLGESPLVAKEIYEIGNDVADRIREYGVEAAGGITKEV